MLKIVDLRTENRTAPLGVDAAAPAFSWRAETQAKNWKQKSWRIEVTQGDKTLWDSGTVCSDEMAQVPYAGAPLPPDSRFCWRLTVCGTDGGAPARAESWFETGLQGPAQWHGSWIGEEAEEFHLYRKTFFVEKKVARARLYVCGLGHFTAALNGEAVSDHVLEPGWSDYRKTCFYTVYDVTELLRLGENAIGCKLGNGMYHVPGGRYVYYERSYGRMKLLVQLNITYADGTASQVVTDKSWRRGPSPITFCCLYGGEDYDGRRAQEGYSRPDFAETDAWGPAPAAEPPAGRLVCQPTAPLRVMRRYAPAGVTQVRGDAWLYDFGTNFSGWASLVVRANGAPAGTAVTMTPGELLGADGMPDQRVTGRGYHWLYRLNGQELQRFAPDFTYTGFRYVLLEGAAPAGRGAPAGVPFVESLEGEFIYPDMAQTGSFSCSNPLFNQIHQLVCQAILSNTKSYLTDCPHRERLGWLEQTHLIAPGLMYNYDMENLYAKIRQDMADAQHDDGLVPDICPEYVHFGYHRGFVDSPEWGSACILAPWYAYQRWGDRRTLETHYAGMKKYLAYLTGKTHHGVLHHGLGDWLDIGPNRPWSQNTPVPLVATAVYYCDICTLKKIARLLGRTGDEKRLETLRRRVFAEYNAQFCDDQTARYATGSQAAQALSLAAGLVPASRREKVVQKLREDIEHRGWRITAGDVGHPFLITACIGENLGDAVYRMTNRTDVPGYGYQLACGATTLTEEWDGPDPQHPHGSQNHFMLGGIEEWFYSGLGGVRLLHSELPFGEVEIAPYVPPEMDACAVRIRHPFGDIRTAWRREGGSLLYEITVPPNLRAHLALPGVRRHTVGSGVWTYTVPPERNAENGTAD